MPKININKKEKKYENCDFAFICHIFRLFGTSNAFGYLINNVLIFGAIVYNINLFIARLSRTIFTLNADNF